VSTVKELADLALAIRAGAGSGQAPKNGTEFTIRYTGPDPVLEISDEVCPPDVVRLTPEWTGACTLKVMAPLNVLEISWNVGEPVRIMAFSRGTWEEALRRA
jgi:hypothetical protein